MEMARPALSLRLFFAHQVYVPCTSAWEANYCSQHFSFDGVGPRTIFLLGTCHDQPEPSLPIMFSLNSTKRGEEAEFKMRGSDSLATALATARAQKPSILAITFYLSRILHAGMRFSMLGARDRPETPTVIQVQFKLL
jgi:hypothetical protein